MDDETAKEKAHRLEIELKTAHQVAAVMKEFEDKFNGRFDKIETMIQERATADQIKTHVARCLDEGDYVKRDELYNVWKDCYMRYTNETRSRTASAFLMAKNVAWAGGALLIASAAIETLRKILGGAQP